MPPKRSHIPPDKTPPSKKPRKTSSSKASAASVKAPAATRKASEASRETTAASEVSASQGQSTASNETPAVSVSKSKKIRLTVSNVHKEFEQTMTQDSNGNKSWASKCTHCNQVYNDKVCSHLKDHLEKQHPDIFKMVEDLDDRDRESLTKKMTTDHTRSGSIREAYLEMVINMGLPLSTGGNPWFIAFYKEIDQEVELPGRKGTTKLIVEVKFSRMYGQMLSILARTRVIHVTIDMWSSFKVSEY